MSNEEAIEILKQDIDLIIFDETTGEALTLAQVKSRNELNYQSYKALEKAIEALERQIAKKVERYSCNTIGEMTFNCPSCNLEYYVTDYEDFNYCPNCGQKIDWSE